MAQEAVEVKADQACPETTQVGGCMDVMDVGVSECFFSQRDCVYTSVGVGGRGFLDPLR